MSLTENKQNEVWEIQIIDGWQTASKGVCQSQSCNYSNNFHHVHNKEGEVVKVFNGDLVTYDQDTEHFTVFLRVETGVSND